MEEHRQARQIVETLNKAGFIAYYAGGWVRDLLLDHPSDDIDIATNAPPQTIQALFPHTVPIGIAFGIILVIVEGHQYEVATFRQDLDYHDGRRPSRIEFTTAEEDAKRRDFTINGMFYDPVTEKIYDFVKGREDLEAKIIRAIGNPHERIREDRLRMIRAVRLSCRFGFAIEPATAAAIRAHAKELFPAVAIERVWQELTKGHAFGKLLPFLIQLHEYGLLAEIFPSLHSATTAEIRDRLAPLQEYPPEAPVIASILPLFPGASFEEQGAICKRLKTSQSDVQFVTLLSQAADLNRRSPELAEWAYFYADKCSSLCLQILAAHLPQSQRAAFRKTHKERVELLKESIGRIQNRTPVVKAEDLIAEGITPGKKMGLLLKEADRIAINEQLHDKGSVLKRLKLMPFWK